jgi:hypothetical protein
MQRSAELLLREQRVKAAERQLAQEKLELQQRCLQERQMIEHVDYYGLLHHPENQQHSPAESRINFDVEEAEEWGWCVYFTRFAHNTLTSREQERR